VYTVYLIDDEKWALYDVKHTCPFAAYGFSVVGESTNALSALDEVFALRPDVVFADIRMPSLTGIDLIHMVKQRLEGTVFVILSGYAEFEYAADALRMGVFDYCLKPMSEESARDLLGRLSAHLKGRSAAPEAHEEEAADYTGGSAQFAALLQYVNEHITDPLALGELAQRFFLNVSYCGELFKSVTGETFTQYVRRRRIQQACELLRRTQLPMSQIALRVGYADLPYFSRLFTAAKGVSPTRYRAANKQTGTGVKN
jgi:two-component system response regulator YesN